MPFPPQAVFPIRTQKLEERIRRRAQEIYKQKGSQPGHALDDWLEAEREEFLRLQDEIVDEASRESFPASDPPAY